MLSLNSLFRDQLGCVTFVGMFQEYSGTLSCLLVSLAACSSFSSGFKERATQGEVNRLKMTRNVVVKSVETSRSTVQVHNVRRFVSRRTSKTKSLEKDFK